MRTLLRVFVPALACLSILVSPAAADPLPVPTPDPDTVTTLLMGPGVCC